MPTSQNIVSYFFVNGKENNVHVLFTRLVMGLKLENVVYDLEIGDGPRIWFIFQYEIGEHFVPFSGD